MNKSNNTDSQRFIVEYMLEFVRAAVLERDPVLPHDTKIDWDELMDISSEHGLLAFVWEGISKLPQKLQPPRQQRINWGLSAQETYLSFNSQVKVLRKILKTCELNGMRLLLLKGLGLSFLYPHPQARLCSDIDIFLFDDYKKGNQIWRSFMVKEIGKHATLKIDGVIVENHNNFLDPNTRQKRKIIKYLYSSLDNIVYTNEGYYVLNPLANLLFLTFHALKHFHGGTEIPIRNIMDLAFFIRSNSDNLIPSECHKLLKQMHLEKSFEMLVSLAEWILCIKLDDYHFHHLPIKDLNIIKMELFCNASRYVVQEGGKMTLTLRSRSRSKLVVAKYVPRNNSYSQIYLPHLYYWLRSRTQN